MEMRPHWRVQFTQPAQIHNQWAQWYAAAKKSL